MPSMNAELDLPQMDYNWPFQQILSPAEGQDSDPIEGGPPTQGTVIIPENDTRDRYVAPVQSNEAVVTELQTLRTQVQLLEQRVMAQPSERERNLEMVIGLLWGALVRSKSSEVQGDSHLRRLVTVFTRGVLNPIADPPTDTPQQTNPADCPLTSGPGFSAVEWEEFLGDSNSAGPSHAIFSDSGYRTDR